MIESRRKSNFLLLQISPILPNGQHLEYPLYIGETTLGRANGSDIPCPTLHASRKHCIFSVTEDNTVYVKDLGGLNGINITSDGENEFQIPRNRQVQIAEYDKIGIGTGITNAPPIEFVFELRQRKIAYPPENFSRGGLCQSQFKTHKTSRRSHEHNGYQESPNVSRPNQSTRFLAVNDPTIRLPETCEGTFSKPSSSTNATPHDSNFHSNISALQNASNPPIYNPPEVGKLANYVSNRSAGISNEPIAYQELPKETRPNLPALVPDGQNSTRPQVSSQPVVVSKIHCEPSTSANISHEQDVEESSGPNLQQNVPVIQDSLKSQPEVRGTKDGHESKRQNAAENVSSKEDRSFDLVELSSDSDSEGKSNKRNQHTKQDASFDQPSTSGCKTAGEEIAAEEPSRSPKQSNVSNLTSQDNENKAVSSNPTNSTNAIMNQIKDDPEIPKVNNFKGKIVENAKVLGENVETIQTNKLPNEVENTNIAHSDSSNVDDRSLSPFPIAKSPPKEPNRTTATTINDTNLSNNKNLHDSSLKITASNTKQNVTANHKQNQSIKDVEIKQNSQIHNTLQRNGTEVEKDFQEISKVRKRITSRTKSDSNSVVDEAIKDIVRKRQSARVENNDASKCLADEVKPDENDKLMTDSTGIENQIKKEIPISKTNISNDDHDVIFLSDDEFPCYQDLNVGNKEIKDLADDHVNEKTNPLKSLTDEEKNAIPLSDDEFTCSQVFDLENEPKAENDNIVPDPINDNESNVKQEENVEMTESEKGSPPIISSPELVDSGDKVDLNLVKEEPIFARSFSQVDDDVINLSDDEFPSSQFFEDVPDGETDVNDSKREDLEEITDENSDTSSTDGDWFQRLSQVTSEDSKPKEDTSKEQDNEQSNLDQIIADENEEIVCAKKTHLLTSSEDDESSNDGKINDLNHQTFDNEDKTNKIKPIKSMKSVQKTPIEEDFPEKESKRRDKRKSVESDSSSSSSSSSKNKRSKSEHLRKDYNETRTIKNNMLQDEQFSKFLEPFVQWIAPNLECLKEKIDVVDNIIAENSHEISKKVLHSTQKEVRRTSLSENDKLTAVNSKIRKSHLKKSIEIIEPKAMTSRKRGNSLETAKEPPETWLFSKKSKTQEVTSKPTAAEIKAIRNEKLKSLAQSKKLEKLDTNETIKTKTTAKNVTKITQKSRNDTFLDTIVDGFSNSRKQYTIPRRKSKDDRENDDVKKQDTPSSSKDCDSGNDSLSFVDKFIIKGGQVSDLPNLKQRVSRVNLNQEVKYIDENNLCFEPKFGQFLPMKSRLKPENSKRSKTKNKVRFSSDGNDFSALQVGVKHYVIDDEKTLKPVTKSERRDPPPNLAAIEDLPGNQEQQANEAVLYVEETIHQICKWRPSWFVEKQTITEEPPLFGAPFGPLQDTYANYRDYRTCLFPLLLYQLWQSVSKHYDQTQLARRNPLLFNMEIRTVSQPSVAKPIFLLPQKSNEQRRIVRLDCQMLLERDSNNIRPRQGDLVALQCAVRQDDTKNNKKVDRSEELMAYLESANVRDIKSHLNVSQSLKAKNKKASQVMDFTLVIRDRDGFQIHPQEGKLKVVKSILSELRLFWALDSLSISPLLNIILDPANNSTELPNIDLTTRILHTFVLQLNEHQKQAVVSVYSAVINKINMLQLVHGPPGSGKSKVIVGMIVQLWQHYLKNRNTEKPQILLCAPSNAAVDEIFSRLIELRNSLPPTGRFNMVRIGPRESISKNVVHWSLDELVKNRLKNQDEPLNGDEQEQAIDANLLEAKESSVRQALDHFRKKETIDAKEFAKQRALEKRLVEVCQQRNDLRKGQKRTMEGRELQEKKKELEMEILGHANVIATTLSSCYNMQMKQASADRRLHISCCIVDEATQCTEPDTLVPLKLGVKILVLVGDPKQLPATVTSQTAKKNNLGRSLFARHQDYWLTTKPAPSATLTNSRCHFLRMQYRMHPEIAQWPNEAFYDKRLQTHHSATERSRNCPLLPYVVIGHELNQNPQEESNFDEAKVIVKLAKNIFRSADCKRLTIGIITPYNKQKDTIQHLMRQEEAASAEEWSQEPESRKRWQSIEVGSVDSYQGREKDVILYSCTRTLGVGFMSDAERLNVALTRARQSLVVCGNFKSLKKDSMWNSFLENAKKRKVFKPFRDILKEDVFKAICKSKHKPSQQR